MPRHMNIHHRTQDWWGESRCQSILTETQTVNLVMSPALMFISLSWQLTLHVRGAYELPEFQYDCIITGYNNEYLGSEDCYMSFIVYGDVMINRGNFKFEVFTAVTVKNAVFQDVATCRSCANRRFGGTYHLRHQGRKICERGTSVSRSAATC
jgi:hypothetical protein